MKKSCTSLIVDFLKGRYPEWIHGARIEQECIYKGWPYKASTVSRKCRLLAEIKLGKMPQLEKKKSNSSSKDIMYRWLKVHEVQVDSSTNLTSTPTPKGPVYDLTFHYTPFIQ